MSIRTTLHLSSEASVEEGTPAEVADKKRRAHDAKPAAEASGGCQT
jgi:hypothetical protein